jgi:uncharacterized protein YegP (UPF0339 family)
MKKITFEIVAFLTMACLLALTFWNPYESTYPAIALAVMFSISAIQIGQKTMQTQKMEHLIRTIEQLTENSRIKDGLITTLECDVQKWKDIAKERFTEIIKLRSQVNRFVLPELNVIREMPAKGETYVKIVQGKDSKWYFSLVGPKGKYIFNSACYENHLSAAKAIVEITTHLREYPVVDNNHALPLVLSEESLN